MIRNISFPSSISAFVFAFLILGACTTTPKGSYLKTHVVAFYNVENLFDTENDPEKEDDDFTPEGRLAWDEDRYDDKILKLARVIASLGGNNAPALIGLCEIENRKVLEDLIQHPVLQIYDFGIVHYESPDSRGIDVAFLYQKADFKVLHSAAKELKIENEPDFVSRDALYVKGLLGEKDTLHLMVNHFPSRRGGAQASEYKRMAAAQVNRQVIDSVWKVSPKASWLVMGDFNDGPSDLSVQKGLVTSTNPEIENQSFYNPFEKLAEDGLGTYYFRGNWDMLDQILVSKGLLGKGSLRFKEGSASVFGPDWLREAEGNFKNTPFRTYAGDIYLGGYSDHFPIYIVLELKN